MNNSKMGNGLIVIMLSIFTIIAILIIWCINKSMNTSEKLPSPDIVLYDPKYVEIDTDIINNIKSYMSDKYSEYDLLSVHVDHSNNLITTTVSIASKEYIDNIYNYTFNKIRKYNYTDIEFYDIPDTESWYNVIKEFKLISENINRNAIIATDIFKLSMINGNDYETIWFTINGDGEIEYDIIKEYFENK